MPHVFTTLTALKPRAGKNVPGQPEFIAEVWTVDGQFFLPGTEEGFSQLALLEQILRHSAKVGLQYSKNTRIIRTVINPEDLQLPVSRSTDELRVFAPAEAIDIVAMRKLRQRTAMSEPEPPMQPQDWNGFHSDLTADELGYRKTSTKRPPAFTAYLAGTFVEADNFAELIENLVAAQVEKLDAENAELRLELADKDAHIERYARQKTLMHLVGIVQRAAGTPLVNLNTEIQDHITALQISIEQDHQEGR